MGFISWLITHIAPIFIITSPVTSYADQIYAIHSTKSSAGFSLDIPLIMLLASTLKSVRACLHAPVVVESNSNE